MHYGRLAATGTSFSLAGVAFGQLWLVGGIMIAVGTTALVIRARFRRGRTPLDH